MQEPDPIFSDDQLASVFADGSTKVSTSTLRFRTRDEIEASLVDTGFSVVDVRDAPDRPGREFVFIARR